MIFNFSVTIQKVHDSAYETWAYHRFRLVTEYYNKTILPPPLNILIFIVYPLYHSLKGFLLKKKGLFIFTIYELYIYF